MWTELCLRVASQHKVNSVLIWHNMDPPFFVTSCFALPHTLSGTTGIFERKVGLLMIDPRLGSMNSLF